MRIYDRSNKIMKIHICRSRNLPLLIVSCLFFIGYAANCTAAPTPSVVERGNMAVVNLGTGLNTTATLNWKGFNDDLGVFRIIYISNTPPSGGTLQNARVIKISNSADSCVVHGLAPGTYYWVIAQEFQNVKGLTQRFSDVARVVVSPPRP
jgi:hypothetical protein